MRQLHWQELQPYAIDTCSTEGQTINFSWYADTLTITTNHGMQLASYSTHGDTLCIRELNMGYDSAIDLTQSYQYKILLPSHHCNIIKIQNQGVYPRTKSDTTLYPIFEPFTDYSICGKYIVRQQVSAAYIDSIFYINLSSLLTIKKDGTWTITLNDSIVDYGICRFQEVPLIRALSYDYCDSFFSDTIPFSGHFHPYSDWHDCRQFNACQQGEYYMPQQCANNMLVFYSACTHKTRYCFHWAARLYEEGCTYEWVVYTKNI